MTGPKTGVVKKHPAAHHNAPLRWALLTLLAIAIVVWRWSAIPLAPGNGERSGRTTVDQDKTAGSRPVRQQQEGQLPRTELDTDTQQQGQSKQSDQRAASSIRRHLYAPGDAFHLILEDLSVVALGGPTAGGVPPSTKQRKAQLNIAYGISLFCALHEQSSPKKEKENLREPLNAHAKGTTTTTGTSTDVLLQKRCESFFSEAKLTEDHTKHFHLIASTPSSSLAVGGEHVIDETQNASEGDSPKSREGKAVKRFLDTAVKDTALRHTIEEQFAAMHRLADRTLSAPPLSPGSSERKTSRSPIAQKDSGTGTAPLTERRNQFSSCPEEHPPTLRSLASSDNSLSSVTLGATIVSAGSVSRLVAQEGLEGLFRIVQRRSAVLYIILNDRQAEPDAMDYQFLNELPAWVADHRRAKRRCSTTVLHTEGNIHHHGVVVGTKGGTSNKGTQDMVVRLTCADVAESPPDVLAACESVLFGVAPAGASVGGAEEREHIDSAGENAVAHGGDVLPKEVLPRRNVPDGLPLRCAELPGNPTVTKVIKLGTKTAIYKGKWEGKDVIWKNFDLWQYNTFEGFRSLMTSASRLGGNLINYPLLTCYGDKNGGEGGGGAGGTDKKGHSSGGGDDPLMKSIGMGRSVWQVQPFVRNKGTLKALMKSTKGKLSWRWKVQIAMQIACIFRYLHSGGGRDNRHGAVRAGQTFTYDDNHPEQYLIVLPAEAKKGDEKAGRGDVQVTMVDIDTVQLALPKATANTGTATAMAQNASNYATKCRCFYCKGRSNCEFINTLQALEACGQVEEPTRAPHIVQARECDASSDGHFVAQLFHYLVTGRGPWPGVAHRTVVERLQSGTVPETKSGNTAYDAIVKDLFLKRLGLEGNGLLNRLAAVCQEVHCGFDECPATVTVPKERMYVDV